MKESNAEALFVTRTALTFNLSKQIADLALTAHLPSCHSFRPAVFVGLVSLDADRVAMIRPAAAQIDKIIKGTSQRVMCRTRREDKGQHPYLCRPGRHFLRQPPMVIRICVKPPTKD